MMDKKQILKIGLSVLFAGATATTGYYILHYNVCPKVKIVSYDKDKNIVTIKWGGKSFTFDSTGSAIYLKWIAKIEDNKVNVYNSKDKLVKSYSIS